MTQVWDADKEQLKDVSESDAKELAHLGVPTGAEAELKSREAGWEGKIGAGLTAFGNSLGLGLPKLITRAISPGVGHNIDSAQQANPNTTLGGNLIGGAASMFAVPGGAAGRIAAGAYSAGNETIDDSVASGEWDKAVQSGDYSKVAEHYAQGVGIGGVLGGAAEGVGYVLAKSAPKFQKAVGKTLTDWSNKGYFQKVFELGELEGTLKTGAQRAESMAQELPAGAPNPMPRPYAGMQMGPPPIPKSNHIPFASAELAHEIPSENIARARAHGEYDTRQATRLAEQPMLRNEAESLWHDYDRSAHDYANAQEFDGESGDLARNDRMMRDRIAGRTSERVADGRTGEVHKVDIPDPQDLHNRYFDTPEEFRASRNEYLTQDPELNHAFEKAGLNQAPEAFAQQPAPQPEITEIPNQGATPPPLPAPKVKIPRPGELASLKGGKFARAVPQADLPQPKLPKLERPVDAIPGGQYEFAPGKVPNLKVGKTAFQAGAATLGMSTGHPLFAELLGYKAAKSALFDLGGGLYKYAQKAAINRAQAINLIVDSVTSSRVKASAKVVKMILQGQTGDISAGYLTGNTDKDYEAIVQGVSAAQANPQRVMNYINERHGPLSTDGKFAGALTGHYQNGINYLAQGMPKQSRPPGLLDGNEPYDPPRSIKVRYLQRYNGVNDPHGALVAPTHESVAAVQAVHPRTLEEIRQNLALELADEKKRNQLSSAQMRDISIIMGIPANWIHSPAGISALAAIGQANGQSPPQNPSHSATSTKGINLGAQGKQFASMSAPPSQANELDNLGEQ